LLLEGRSWIRIRKAKKDPDLEHSSSTLAPISYLWSQDGTNRIESILRDEIAPEAPEEEEMEDDEQEEMEDDEQEEMEDDEQEEYQEDLQVPQRRRRQAPQRRRRQAPQRRRRRRRSPSQAPLRRRHAGNLPKKPIQMRIFVVFFYLDPTETEMNILVVFLP
jgi:hypothetical protein